LRARLTDLSLIEEKLDTFLLDLERVVNENKHQLKSEVTDFLQTIEQSDTLMNLINIRTRD